MNRAEQMFLDDLMAIVRSAHQAGAGYDDLAAVLLQVALAAYAESDPQEPVSREEWLEACAMVHMKHLPNAGRG